ncbi:hypothetical protein P3T36_003239 [Kitasatospora sp. MAP12-15]|uniref:hypothetical protein n=1 Tax=unclassified Kitasatospora TaxID=2633591 RepID=UPI002474D0F3|nr:hypothetical protein [Kitasatospora sp. MAP12-44]MDH6111215.1 hypothetical protein [Kitasatospora sp. MAP12-44]
MADIYELSLAVDLRDDLSDAELAELRWHLGLAPRPDSLSIVRAFPFVVGNDLGELVTEDDPAPLLGQHGEARKVAGALTSVLLRREESRHGGWALTARQEAHPDDFDRLGELLSWLATKTVQHHERLDGSVELGWIRFYESDQPNPLTVRDAGVSWP